MQIQRRNKCLYSNFDILYFIVNNVAISAAFKIPINPVKMVFCLLSLKIFYTESAM